MSIATVVELLTQLLNEKKVWIYDKEEHLLGMSKQLTAIISDWDTETHQMIVKLHEARDKQVSHCWVIRCVICTHDCISHLSFVSKDYRTNQIAVFFTEC